MSVGGSRVREVRCPACGGASVYAPENPWRPFCSERCKNHDFGAWATERYRVAAKPDPGDDEGDESLPPQPGENG
jgi:endogenous inhibitor of DNA gyrase (YacG/DUF329 family)